MREIYCLLLIGLVSTLIVGITHCDHLRQTTDEESEEQVATGSKEQQYSDPDFLKRELKDLILRQIDSDSDGHVSYEELKNYLAVLHDKNIEFNVDKQWVIYSPQIHEVFSWEGYEPEKKEVLTWDHYFNQTYPELVGVDIGVPLTREQDTSRILNPQAAEKLEDLESKKKDAAKSEEDTGEDPHMKVLRLMVLRADARWKLADENGDTLLTKPEFKLLLHPDEGNEELQNLFVKEATEDMDLNKDSKICLDEFMKHLQVLASDQEKNDQHWLSSQQENFGRFLDKNKDGVLDGDEIKNWLIPPKSKKFELEAKRLLDIGDLNEDHKLSNAEILEQYEQYLSLLPNVFWKNLQEQNDRHETLNTDSRVNMVDHDEL